MFNSEEPKLDESSRKNYFKSIDSVDPREIDEHFKAYAANRAYFETTSDNSLTSLQSCFCDSALSMSSEKSKTSLMMNQLECDQCKNLIVRQENRRCSMCCDCVEKLYSPKICMACNGRVSFQELRNSSIRRSVSKKHFNEFNETSLRLCNCFPKYPSQHFSSIQPSEPSEIQILPSIIGTSCSYNELVFVQQKKKSSSPFYSHNCLPLKSNHSDESSSEDE